ncbi:hypothetical protein SAMN04244573_02204 [Azotobacter beijerinckii]|uniref:Uncharacterized protein n=1 Tax=Azotobacter beijerinckii TaxID=170623 RepID=A0A1H9IQ20_9GAMM|nr:hypothetical protein SAMN04244573_02204 [Azotobacter beijerinckii]
MEPALSSVSVPELFAEWFGTPCFGPPAESLSLCPRKEKARPLIRPRLCRGSLALRFAFHGGKDCTHSPFVRPNGIAAQGVEPQGCGERPVGHGWPFGPGPWSGDGVREPGAKRRA